jgi:hypothetical protein
VSKYEFGQRRLDLVELQAIRVEFLERHREALGVILDRAVARGELPPGVSPGTVADVVFGAICYRLLASRQPLDHRSVDELVTMLAAPELGPASPTSTSRSPT